MAGLDFKAKVKMNRKSQVTMLMIVGLVLFIIVSLVLYLSKSAVKKQNQQNIKKVHETAMDTKPIKEFINKCLDKLAKDAFVLLGKQGGYIYSSQGGTLVDYSGTDEGLFFVKYDNYNVAYNILPPKFAVPPYSSETPDYPWPTFPYKTANSNAEIFDGFFGISNMPPLNSSEGSNSIQAQIEAFIDNNIASCADLSMFKNQGYKIDISSSKTQVEIASRDVRIKSEIPIKITNVATKETSEIKDFSTEIKINLRDSYFFVKKIIENDIKNIKFNISDTGNNKESVKIRLIKNIFSDNIKKIKADLVIVTDEGSLIYGKPFQYVFAKRNRAPALYYIKTNVLSLADGYMINESDLLQNKPLRAEDPDENDLAFNIYIGEFGQSVAQFPSKLNVPQRKFRAEVSDGQLLDYQMITVNRK